jgi:hypothetical protein
MAPSYVVVNQMTNSVSAMAVHPKMIQGKYSSMVFMIVMGLPPNKCQENAT